MTRLNLTSLDTYRASCVKIANANFSDKNMAAVAAYEEEFNTYTNLENLETPRNLMLLEDVINEKIINRAKEAILEGLILWEHTAAGEATRLKLGPKYFIHPQVHLSRDYLASHFTGLPQTAGDDPLAQLHAIQQKLLPLHLGARHLLQNVFEIKQLAENFGLDPDEVMARQKFLLVVNEQTCREICALVQSRNFLGLAPHNFLFMAQSAFTGLSKNGGWHFDEQSPRRLHNHGQMAMQKTMDHQIFHLNENGQPVYLTNRDFFSLLGDCADQVSYNIEDLGYLSQALDFVTIGLALFLGEQGYGMTMEIVANNPQSPIKGGLCAFDPALGHDVVIESFRLKNIEPSQLKYLNKNFNHYPNPAATFRKLHEDGLFMPIAVKDDFLYFQPVQGDLNFLTKTAFITRKSPQPIYSWKSSADTIAAVTAMHQQDMQPGFTTFASTWYGL